MAKDNVDQYNLNYGERGRVGRGELKCVKKIQHMT